MRPVRRQAGVSSGAAGQWLPRGAGIVPARANSHRAAGGRRDESARRHALESVSGRARHAVRRAGRRSVLVRRRALNRSRIFTTGRRSLQPVVADLRPSRSSLTSPFTPHVATDRRDGCSLHPHGGTGFLCRHGPDRRVSSGQERCEIAPARAEVASTRGRTRENASAGRAATRSGCVAGTAFGARGTARWDRERLRFVAAGSRC